MKHYITDQTVKIHAGTVLALNLSQIKSRLHGLTDAGIGLVRATQELQFKRGEVIALERIPPNLDGQITNISDLLDDVDVIELPVEAEEMDESSEIGTIETAEESKPKRGKK